jgi:hypothetical protein
MDLGELVGFEERVAEMINFLCVVLGGVFALFALVSIMDYTGRATEYSTLAMAFLLFPLAAAKVFKNESYPPSPPAIVKKRKR